MGRLVTMWNLFCRHKYLVVTVAFVAIIGVLDENSLIRRMSHKYEIATLKSEIVK